MNRPIKFRAWLGYEMSYDYVDFSKNYHDWGATNEPLWEGEHKNEYVLMQFTGLLDKNGKEIYEGDVYQVAKNKKYEIRFITSTEYDEVTCGFGLFAEDIGYGFVLDTFAIKEGEIIGNIFENPELIEKP